MKQHQPNKKISINENLYYEIIQSEILGQGSFGKVYKAYQRKKVDGIETKIKIAAKVIDVEHLEERKMKKQLTNEINILQSVKSPNIVEIIDVAGTNKNVYVFLEYCEGGDLRNFLINRGGRITMQEALIFFKQLCDGFKELNRQNILHRDIKPENILMDLQGNLKISDFGLSRITSGYGELLTINVGTPRYQSPEMIFNQPNYGSKIDVWSLGITFYEILFGLTPWNGADVDELAKNLQTSPLTFPQVACSPSIKHLLTKMLEKDPQKRFDWADVFSHEVYMQSTDEIIQNQAKEIYNQHQDDILKQTYNMSNYYTEKTKFSSVHNRSSLYNSFRGIPQVENGETSTQNLNINNNNYIDNNNNYMNKDNNNNNNGLQDIFNGLNINNMDQQNHLNQQLQQQQHQQQMQYQQQQQQYNNYQNHIFNLNQQLQQQQQQQQQPFNQYQFQQQCVAQQQQNTDFVLAFQRLDKYFNSRRIVSMYMNSVANQIFLFKNTLMAELQIPELQIVQILFLLIKKFFIGHMQLVDILQGKSNGGIAFTEQEIQFYRQSQNCNDLMNLAAMDLMQIRPFFQNFFAQISNINFNNTEFQNLLNSNFVYEENQKYNLNGVFSSICNQFIANCMNMLGNSQLQNKSQIFKIILNTLFCKKSDVIFDFSETKEFDFFKFDEQNSNLSEQQMYEYIKQLQNE